jgi:uncharacterized protein
MKLPCETAIWYTLPQIRADLARELVKGGMSQKAVAEKLGLTPAAVSQYLHKKRGNSTRMPAGYGGLISDAAQRLRTAADSGAVQEILCKCCTGSRCRKPD